MRTLFPLEEKRREDHSVSIWVSLQTLCRASEPVPSVKLKGVALLDCRSLETLGSFAWKACSSMSLQGEGPRQFRLSVPFKYLVCQKRGRQILVSGEQASEEHRHDEHCHGL